VNRRKDDGNRVIYQVFCDGPQEMVERRRHTRQPKANTLRRWTRRYQRKRTGTT